MLNKYLIANEEKISKNDLKTIYRFFRMGDLKVSEDVINWLYKCARERTNIENKNYLSKASNLLLRKKFKEATDLVKKFYDENHIEKEEIQSKDLYNLDNQFKKFIQKIEEKAYNLNYDILLDKSDSNGIRIYIGNKKDINNAKKFKSNSSIFITILYNLNYQFPFSIHLIKNGKEKLKERFDVFEKLLTSLNEYLNKLINEETTSGDVAPFSSMLLGKPLFRVPDSLFYKIGYSDRNQHGWYKKFYGTELGQWCKENRGKKFTIKHETKDLYIDCEAK